MSLPAPFALLAELTHRCPLACPYCSNPLELERKSDELATGHWVRALREAADLGVLQVHFSGGEPAVRGDLEELVAAAAAAGLYSNLITSGIGLSAARLEQLALLGLDHVQLSIQDVDPANADRIAGLAGGHGRKRAFARQVVDAGLPLTINVVLHRYNISRVSAMAAAAIAMGARRIELAHAQYYGWGAMNRAALMPDEQDAVAVSAEVARLREQLAGAIAIDYVPPDYFSLYPKPCMNGWGRQSLNITPGGLALPCHAAQSIPNLTFWNIQEHSVADIWQNSPAFGAFRGDDWMRAPCRNCERRHSDFGGCRCQAMALTGDARNTDPVCTLSPQHGIVEEITRRGRDADYVMRGRPAR